MAFLYAAVFTILISLVEVKSEAKTSFSAIFTVPLLLYTSIYLIGNLFATLAASLLQEAQLGDLQGEWVPFVHAFAGVFAFQGVLGHTNLTVYGQGLLTIEDWIAKARDGAVASAAERQLRLSEKRAIEYAHVLSTLPDDKLNAYIAQHLGPDAIAALEEQVPDGTDIALYKAQALAYNDPDRAEQLAKLHSGD